MSSFASDLLGAHAGAPGKKKGKKKSKKGKRLKKPKAMSRETFSLLDAGTIAALAAGKDSASGGPTSLMPSYLKEAMGSGRKTFGAKGGDAAKAKYRAIKWVWAPYRNPARDDDVQFFRWAKDTEKAEPYPYARFDMEVDLPAAPSEEEWRTVPGLENEDWSREDSDRLIMLCSRFALVWPVITDRFNHALSAVPAPPTAVPASSSSQSTAAAAALPTGRAPGERTMEQLKARAFAVFHAVAEHREVGKFRDSYMHQQMQRKQGRPSKVALAAEVAVRAAVAAAQSVAEGARSAASSPSGARSPALAPRGAARRSNFAGDDADAGDGSARLNPAAVEFAQKEEEVRTRLAREWKYDEALDAKRCEQLDAQFLKTDSSERQQHRELQNEISRIDVQMKRMVHALRTSKAPVHHGFVSPRRVHASNFDVAELQHARALFSRRVAAGAVVGAAAAGAAAAAAGAEGGAGAGAAPASTRATDSAGAAKSRAASAAVRMLTASAAAQRDPGAVLESLDSVHASGGMSTAPSQKRQRVAEGAADAATATTSAVAAGVAAPATYLRSSKFALAPEDRLSQRMGGKIDMVLRELDIPVPAAGKSTRNERANRIMPTRAVLSLYDRLRHDVVLCLSLQKHVARLEAVVGEELKRRDDVKIAKAEKVAARAAAKRKRDEEVRRQGSVSSLSPLSPPRCSIALPPVRPARVLSTRVQYVCSPCVSPRPPRVCRAVKWVPAMDSTTTTTEMARRAPSVVSRSRRWEAFRWTRR